MGAYKRDVVVVIKMGAYIHGMLILCGCLLSQFYGMLDLFPHMRHMSSTVDCVGFAKVRVRSFANHKT